MSLEKKFFSFSVLLTEVFRNIPHFLVVQCMSYIFIYELDMWPPKRSLPNLEVKMCLKHCKNQCFFEKCRFWGGGATIYIYICVCTTKYHHFTVSGTKIYSAYTLLAIKKSGANPLCSVWQTSQECIFPCYLSFPCCIYSKSAESIFLVETVPIVSPSASMHLGIPQGFSTTWYGYQWETPIWDNPKSVSDDPSTSRSRYSVTQTNLCI